jgi:hypothetical protein
MALKSSGTLRDENYIKETVDYLKRNMAKGYSLDSLKWALINQGKSRVLIEKSVEIVREEMKKEQEIKSLQSKQVQPQIVEMIREEEQQPRKKGFFSRIFG